MERSTCVICETHLSGKVGGFRFGSFFLRACCVFWIEKKRRGRLYFLNWKLDGSGLFLCRVRSQFRIHVWNMPRVSYAIMRISDILQASIAFDMRSHTCRNIPCYVLRFHWTMEIKRTFFPLNTTTFAPYTFLPRSLYLSIFILLLIVLYSHSKIKSKLLITIIKILTIPMI